MKLSENFSLREMTRSQTASREGIPNDPDPLVISRLRALCHKVLQPVRDHFGIVSVTSGYRSAQLNAAIGGSTTSQHMKGEAADIEVAADNLELAHWIKENVEFDQLISECYVYGEASSGWVHVSYRADGQNRGQCLTFNRGKGYTKGLPELM